MNNSVVEQCDAQQYIECEKTLSYKDVENVVINYESALCKSGLLLENYKIVKASEEPLGFQADYYKLIVCVRSGDDEVRKLHFFIKSLPDDVEKANKLKEAGYFNREINVYNKIFTKFEMVGAPTGYHARCLYSTENDIILEDLSAKGYSLTNSRNTFDRKHCMAALKSLAKFHAASFILEETLTKQTGNIYRIEDEFKDFLTECGYILSGWYTAGMEASLAAIKKCEIYESQTDIYSKIIQKWPVLFKETLELCRPSTTKRNVLSHRDLWANNIMFNYDESKNPLNCILVDYQACRCMPPGGDVTSLIYLNLNSKQRSEMFHGMLEFYYKTLQKELLKHNISVSTVLNWDGFVDDCNVYKKWGLVQSVMLHQVGIIEGKRAKEIFKDPKDYERLLNVSRADLITHMIESDEVYKERLMDTIHEIIKTYINSE